MQVHVELNCLLLQFEEQVSLQDSFAAFLCDRALMLDVRTPISTAISAVLVVLDHTLGISELS